MNSIHDLTDKWGLIKPQVHWNDSGNGVLYTVIASSLNLVSRESALIVVSECLDFERGVLKRTPDNQFGQESHDNWTAILTLALFYPKYGHMLSSWIFRRFGFMQNVAGRDNFFKSQVLRFPAVIILAIATATKLKALRKLCGIALRFISYFDKIKVDDASGAQLCYLKAYAASVLLDKPTEINKFYVSVETETGSTFHKIMAEYYSEGHPIVSAFRLQCLNEI